MEQINNLDVVLLVIVAISILVSVVRGFVKEVLSILGWILAGVSVYYLLPIIDPITKKYIESELLVTTVNSMGVLLIFCIFWILLTDKLSFFVKNSKFCIIDRIFGIFFGFARGIIVVVLIQILISSLIPEEAKQGIFAESKYFKLAEESSKPIKELIPEKWIEEMKEKAVAFNLDEGKVEDKKEGKENIKEENKVVDVIKNENSVVLTDILQKSGDELFEQLVQPKVVDENNNLDTLKQGIIEAVELLEAETKEIEIEDNMETIESNDEIISRNQDDELDELLEELEDVN